MGSAISSAAAIVYPAAAHQLCLLHWFWSLEKLTPELGRWQRRKFRREFWWDWEGDDEAQVRRWAASFCRRWRFQAPEMVEKFQTELPRVLAYLRFPMPWRHRLRRRTRQVLSAYGLQALPRKNQTHKPRAKANTYPLPITPGGGHFYCYENRVQRALR